MKKSPRVELLVMAGLLVLAMVTYVWMQNRATKPVAPKSNVTIQDGKTIDFSSGRPVVKDDAQEKIALARAVAEMDAAARNVTFEPTTPTQKKAAPPPAPPKP